MGYNLGIDIGIASIGFSAVTLKDQKILCSGAHIFEAAENPKTGASLAEPRRAKRGTRRVIRGRVVRKHDIRHLLAQHGLKDIQSIDSKNPEGKPAPPSVWDFRKAALERLLTDAEFARVLFHIAKRRGFQSNRKGAEPNDLEGKKALSGAQDLQVAMTNACASTIGSYLSTLPKQRNGDGSYERFVTRDLLREEIAKIFEAQKRFGNSKATPQLEYEYAGSGKKEERNTREGDGVAFYQRPLKSSEHLVGTCFFTKEKRAPKFSYTAELFILWTKLNNCKIRDIKGNERFLTQVEKNRLADKAHTLKSLSYKQAREKLELTENERFNISYRQIDKNDNSWENIRDAAEKKDFLVLPGYHALKDALDTGSTTDWQKWIGPNRDKLDDIARILSFHEDKKEVDEQLSVHGLLDEQKTALCKITIFCKTIDLSLKALRWGKDGKPGILENMMQGMIYDKACEASGYNHSAHKNMGLSKIPPFKDVRNPVINRALAQARKVINALIRTHGMPDTIIVELGRDVGKPLQGYWVDRNGKKKQGKGNTKNGDKYIVGRRDIEKRILSNQAEKDHIRNEIISEGILKEPKGADILKYRLWKEQQGFCPYCGSGISPSQLRDGTETQVDHILPYSRSWDDSYMNKAICHTSCNQEKGNETPIEYFKRVGRSIQQLESLPTRMHLPAKKSENILMESFEDNDGEWKKRALNDTRAISKALREHLLESLAHANGQPVKVEVRSGAITAHLRGVWGFTDEKLDEIIRILEAGGSDKELTKGLLGIGLSKEYAERAISVKDSEKSELKAILRERIPYKDRSNDRHHALDAIVLACSTLGMVQAVANHNRYGKEGKNLYPPAPWENFRADAMAAVYGPKNADGKREGGIFVSRMPVRKITGAAHEDTIRSIRMTKEGERQIIQTVKLKDLTLQKLEDMVDRPRNFKLYNVLKERLDANDGKADKAFAEPIYMPTNDPTKQGPRIHSIRMLTSEKSGIEINNGLASNGDMVRVDVFQKDKKFWLVPIYVHHFAQNRLPNQAIIAYKDESEWEEMKEEDFLFSLYKNDLIRVTTKKGNILAYYVGTDRATGSITIKSHDNDPSFSANGDDRTGVKTAISFEKYSVDYFGKISRIEKETRLGVADLDDPESGEDVPVQGASAAAE